MAYGPFLMALFVLAGGLSILETSAHLYIIAMSPEALSNIQSAELSAVMGPYGSARILRRTNSEHGPRYGGADQ